MKKLILLIILIFTLAISYIAYDYYISKDNSINNEKVIIKDNISNNKIKTENSVYKDNNPINKIGLYKYHGRNVKRELIKEYSANWQYHTDISSFEVYYTNEESINSNWLPETFDEYKNNFSNINNYRIGYHINFITNDKEINKTILSPKDTDDFFTYLEVYLYDDYHREKGFWYSHTTEEEYNNETLLTSIKLTAGKQINKIKSDITLTVFTYDEDDFDDNNNYRGNSKYTIIVKNIVN